MAKNKTVGGESGGLKRKIIGLLALADVGMKAWAIADLATRPQSEVRGPKAAWAVGLTVVNSVGILPAAYLLLGRQVQD